MDQNAIKIYFITINLLAILLSGIKVMLVNYHKKVDILQYVIDWVIFLGGGIGSGIIFVVFERSVNKKDFSRFALKTTFMLIQILYLLSYFGPFKTSLQQFFKSLMESHSYFIYYLLAINLLTALVFMSDQVRCNDEY